MKHEETFRNLGSEFNIKQYCNCKSVDSSIWSTKNNYKIIKKKLIEISNCANEFSWGNLDRIILF